ncbi:hypothetical protein NE237_027554 [Protea cynaroides]|uniref:Uncharacterized protein n=1 Tax=Protea cynaroides TaxID=273540 RepID=A0A9Q0GMR0_9MAGN|nr:hypothetical protein NE237_027554 [Protea cynaroides]
MFSLVQDQDVYSISVVSKRENTVLQCPSQFSFLSFLEVPYTSESESSLDNDWNSMNCVSLERKSAEIFSSCSVDIDVEEILEMPKTEEQTVHCSVKTESALTLQRASRREIGMQIGGKIVQLLLNQSLILLKSSSSADKSVTEGGHDTPSSRWRKYKRAASLDPRTVVIFFSVLSSMGTLLLIYLTLRVKQIGLWLTELWLVSGSPSRDLTAQSYVMNKLGFPGMKSLDQLRSLSGSVSGTVKSFQAPSRSQSDSFSSSGFANLKLTAEKLAKEQASVKTCLEMTNSKLKKSAEHIQLLEEKLQNAINENAKLSVKQNEDAKLWKGLESKFSSTRTLCDQLTETLLQLAGQVQSAEQDKKLFEDKLCANSKAFDILHLQMNDLSVNLESAEQTIRNREQVLMELRIEKEEMEKTYGDEHCRAANLIKEKDSVIKQLEESLAAEKLDVDSLNSQLKEMHLELSSKEDTCKVLRSVQGNLETEKNALHSSNEEFAKKLLISDQEITSLEDLIRGLEKMSIELDKQSLTVSNKVVQLNSAFDTCYKLSKQEKDLASKLSRCQFDRLHGQFLHVISEKDSLNSVKEGLNNKVLELQNVQEFVMVQHAEECRVAEEKIRRLESEVETYVSKKTELEMLVTKLEEEIKNLTDTSNQSENKMRDLLLKISTLESENQDIQEKSQAKILEKADKINTFEKEIGKHLELVDSLEKQISQLHDSSKKKEQQLLQSTDREKQLEDKKEEIQSQLAVAESKLVEAKKQYDLMLESKQLELSKHLKEISQRNDQAINDIRRKYEVEKLEIVNLEKEKADRITKEMEKKYDLKIAESKEESRQYLMRVQEEHVALMNRIQLEHDKKELGIKADHKEELKHIQLQADNELNEKIVLLREEHEVQMEDLRHQHEDECAKLQEELDLQKSKEERQRALLQLQWKVMSDKPQEEEVNSKKEYSISSIKMHDPDDVKRSQHSHRRPETIGKDSSFLRAKRTPGSNVLKKADKVNTGSVIGIPKHGKKVTHHEYEVATANGRTITKRRKTSTVMFGNPKQQKMMNTPKTKTCGDVKMVVKGGGHSRPSNIVDGVKIHGTETLEKQAGYRLLHLLETIETFELSFIYHG